MNFAEIIKSAFDANKDNLGEQSVFTPVDELVKCFDFKKAINEKSDIGIMYNVEFLEYFLRDSNYINGKKFTYFYDSIVDRNLAFKVMMYYKYNNVELISIENFNVKEFNMPKHFDVLFTNPPYNDGKDISLLKNLIDNNMVDEIICVHPASFLFNHNDTKAVKDIKNTNSLKEVTLFWGNDMFGGTEIKHAHCISVWNKEHNSSNVTIIDKAFVERKDVYDVNTFSYNTDVNEITVHSLFHKKAFDFLKKFENCDSIFKNRTNIDSSEKTDYGFRISPIRRGLDYAKRNYGMFFSLFGNGAKALKDSMVDKNFKLSDYTMSCSTYKNNYPMWYFKTEEERQNFITYLKTKAVRFLLSLVKCNTNLNAGNPTRIIPWMDFTKTWTDEQLVKEFGIDAELWDYIDKFIPDYYEDYRNTARGNI